jgi:hypothetical protein
MYFVIFWLILSHSTCILSHFVCFFSHFITFHHISYAFCHILYDFEWNWSSPFYHTSDKICNLSHFVWFDHISHVFCHIVIDFITFHMHFIIFCMLFQHLITFHMRFVAFCLILSHFTCMLSHFVRFRMEFVLTLPPHFWENMYYVTFWMVLSSGIRKSLFLSVLSIKIFMSHIQNTCPPHSNTYTYRTYEIKEQLTHQMHFSKHKYKLYWYMSSCQVRQHTVGICLLQ